MRVALLHPTYWPEVRRGSERVVHDLGVALAGRGHEVTVITSHRGRRRRSVEDGLVIDRALRPPDLAPLRFYEHYLATIPAAAVRVARGRFDVVHAFSPSDAIAAALARRWGAPPFVFSIHGIPTREFLVSRRYRLELLHKAVADAAELTVLSDAAAEPTRRYLLREPTVLPPGVDLGQFGIERERDRRPTALCATSLGDPRKRGQVLIGAFEKLRARLPEARLVLAGGADMPAHAGVPVSLPDGVIRLALDRTDELATAYASAWITVLPSVEEAFGLVLVESMAAGTPVVAARSGAAPEVITDALVGSMFEPEDDAGLVEALAEALSAEPSAEQAVRCRARAEEFDLGRVASSWERIYTRAVAAG